MKVAINTTRIERYNKTRHMVQKPFDLASTEIHRAISDHVMANTEVWVIVDAKRVVQAAISVEFEKGSKAHILHIGSMQSGMGSKLVDFIVERARVLNHKVLYLTAYKSALQFYAKMGFKRNSPYANGEVSNIFTMDLT